jgi:hypothetical protein
MSVEYNGNAERYINMLVRPDTVGQGGSETARKMLSAMKTAPDRFLFTTNLSDYANGLVVKPEILGCGYFHSKDVSDVGRGFGEKFLRLLLNSKAYVRFVHIMAVNPDCTSWSVDIHGKRFKSSVERSFAHEMGHCYEEKILHGSDYNKAIYWENKIAKELDPDAPERAVSDHGNFRDYLKNKKNVSFTIKMDHPASSCLVRKVW